jgi:type III secretion protein C
MRNALIGIVAWLAGCGALLSIVAVAADDIAQKQPDWYDKPYPYVLVDQDLRVALGEFGHHLGVIMVLSEKVRGRSRGNLRAATAGEFLTLLSDSNHLSWYFDGHVLHINAEEEAGTRLFNRASADLEQLHGWLDGLDAYGQPLSVRVSADGSELAVFGSPPYLARVQQHLDQIVKPVAAPEPVRKRAMRIFRGSTVNEVSP